MQITIQYNPIGIICSPFREARDTPIQPVFAKGAEGTVDIFPEYVEGLKDLEGFSHIYLIYHFHLSKDFSLKVKPYLDEKLHGLFSTRSPTRPNPIGLSMVRLVNIEGGRLFIRDVDIINGTPLLDIKPYIPDFERRGRVNIGWLEDKIKNYSGAKQEGRE